MKLLAALVIAVALAATVVGQDRGQGAGQGRGQGLGRGQFPGQVPPSNLPETPTAVALPAVSAVTAPGTMYESVQSLAPGKGLANFNYEAKIGRAHV